MIFSKNVINTDAYFLEPEHLKEDKVEHVCRQGAKTNFCPNILRSFKTL